MDYGLYKIGFGAYEYYRDHVKGNENISFEQAQRKLTRNLLLATPAKVQKHPDKRLFLYGNLQLLVVGDSIVWIKNGTGTKRFRKDEDMYNYYTQVLGIVEEPKNENVEW